MNRNILSSFWGFQWWLPPSFSGSEGGRKGNQNLAELSQQKTHSCENNGIIIKQNKKCPETTFLVNLVIKQDSLKGPHSLTERRAKIFGRIKPPNDKSVWCGNFNLLSSCTQQLLLSELMKLKSYFLIKVRYIGDKVDIGQCAIKIYKQKPHEGISASRLV